MEVCLITGRGGVPETKGAKSLLKRT